MENISFQYPTYFLLLCLALGLIYGLLLYLRNPKHKEWSSALPIFLGVLRFLGITILASLLLAPLLRSFSSESKKPVIVIGQDVSESVGSTFATVADKDTYLSNFSALEQQLDEQFEVKSYSFGKELREGIDTSFNDKVTNISKFIKEVEELYDNQNLGALILASDGIFNEGSNPLYGVKKIGAPVYTVAIGDTTPQVDLVLKRVLHNNIAYLGDKFSIQIDVSARNLAGNKTSLEITKLNDSSPAVLKRVNLNINKEDYFHTEEVILDANAAGVQRYRVRVLPTAGEATTANNGKEFYIDVLDARQKILILADSPHPDISAIKQSLGSNKNYEIEVAYAKQAPTDLAKYSFAILHQLPSKKFPVTNVLKLLKNAKTPILFIAGNNSNINALSAAQPLVNIRVKGNNTNDVTPILGANFNLFTLGDQLITSIEKYPPLSVPFGEFDGSTIGETLLLQEIKKVETKYPLLSIGEQGGTKIGLLCGEGIWRWRLFDFLSNENHDNFDQLFSKIVQYLSVKEDKRKFRVSIPKNVFKENEEVLLDGELYNSSYELINTPEASISVKSSTGKEYNYTFSKSQNAYSLNIGILPVGNYSFTANTTYTGEKYNYKGQFSVQPIQLEMFNTTADHKLLNLLSDEFGGKTIAPAQIPQLAQQLKENPALKPIIYQTTTTKSVMDLKWIALIILSLFSLEWFLRRFYGTY